MRIFSFLSICVTVILLSNCSGDRVKDAIEPILKQEVTNISIDMPEKVLKIGDEFLIKVNHRPSYLEVPNYTWESTDVSVASVQNGVVRAVSPGQATIKVTVYNTSVSAEIKIVVSEVEITSIIISSPQINERIEGTNTLKHVMRLGETAQLYAEVQPQNAKDKSFIWKSDNPQVATIDSTGLLTAVWTGLSPKQTWIYAIAANGVRESVNITVYPPAVTEVRTQTTITVVEGGRVDHKYALFPENADPTVSVSVSDTSLVRFWKDLDENILYVTGRKKGLAQLYIKPISNSLAAKTVNVEVLEFKSFYNLPNYKGFYFIVQYDNMTPEQQEFYNEISGYLKLINRIPYGFSRIELRRVEIYDSQGVKLMDRNYEQLYATVYKDIYVPFKVPFRKKLFIDYTIGHTSGVGLSDTSKDYKIREIIER